MKIQQLISAAAIAILFTGCASTQSTTNPFIESGDVLLEETSSAAPSANFVESGDVLL